MEKQGALIADRPGIISAGELLSGGQSIALTRTGERLRHMRRFVVRDTVRIFPVLFPM